MSTLTEKVAIELGRPLASLTPEEQASIEQWGTQARMLIGAQLPLASLDPTVVETVVVWAVVARMVAPRPGAVSVEVGVDDARMVERFTDAGSGVRIRPEWWVLLDPSSRGAFSVRPVFESDGTHDAW